MTTPKTDINVICDTCKGPNVLIATEERPVLWKCAAILEKGPRKGEMCGAPNIIEAKPAKS